MTNEKGITAKELRNVLFAVVVFAILFFFAIRFIQAVIIVLLIFAIVVFIAIVLNPIVNWGERHKIPRGLTVAVIILAIAGFIMLIIWLSEPVIMRQVRDVMARLPKYLEELRSWVARRSPSLAEQIPHNVGDITHLLGSAAGGVFGYAVTVIEAIAALFIILFASIYLLANPTPIAEGLVSLFPVRDQDRVVSVMQQINTQIRAWALATLIGMIAIFTLSYIALTIIGIRPALLFALIAGLLEIVPTLGPILSAIPPLLSALAVEPVKAIYVVIAYTIIQELENHVIVPLVHANRLRLHPLSIIFTIAIMAVLFGFIGIFLAAPTAAVVKILYDELYLKPQRENAEARRLRAEEITDQDQGD